jgi:SRSO17 transposase
VGIPDTVRHREKWRLALDMLDQMINEWGMPQRPVTSDSGYGDATEFRLGLDERGVDYVVEVDPTASAYPADATPAPQPYTGRGRPPKPDYPHPPTNLEHLALACGRGALHTVTWRHGSRHTADNPTAAMRSRFLAVRARPLCAASSGLSMPVPSGFAEPETPETLDGSRRHPGALRKPATKSARLFHACSRR